MKIGFIGAGNMGGALAEAVRAALPDCEIYISDMSTEKAAALAAVLKGKAVSNERIASECDFVFFGVKPSALAVMINGIKDTFKHRENDFTIVSMAAGVTMKSLSTALGFPCSIIRIMPNTPVAVGEGMVLWCSNEYTGEEARQQFCEILSAAGILDELDEYLSTPNAPFPAAAPRLHICL